MATRKTKVAKPAKVTKANKTGKSTKLSRPAAKQLETAIANVFQPEPRLKTTYVETLNFKLSMLHLLRTITAQLRCDHETVDNVAISFDYRGQRFTIGRDADSDGELTITVRRLFKE